ncbi:AAA family ATPase [Mesobacillus foraminis]|uniref:ATP-binding protein n=1 Tax=Mesobacillus foraminis TaxID=279826 RepID=UPI001BE8EF96|nr:AAA family ATPase [Mesobacillus foraminis]MBT2759422.1 AAA family ATPase [Mesobacillus foraminis]
MYITEIHIYGYGKLENIQITALRDFQVFYGENEAGKSTIMSFIHSVLFGFPAKQQAEPRYEPKKHSKYGGLIKARHLEKGTVIIERVKGKAAGDVTVSLEDGTIGGEELLHELMGGMDKGTFQSIFSFNLKGLQNIHQLKGEEIGRYLFSAGALGTDKLLKAETRIQKELDHRFKPGGKKPVLNDQLKELRMTYEALKKAEQESGAYESLALQKEETEQKLKHLDQKKQESENSISRLNELLRVQPLMAEERQLNSHLDKEGEIIFPHDGINRLERIVDQLKPIEARISWLEDRAAAIGTEARTNKPDEELLEQELTISAQLDKLPDYDQLRRERSGLELKLEEITEEIEKTNDRLHVDFNEVTISKVDTSVFIGERAEEVQLQQQRMEERRLALEETFQEETAAMEALENKAASLKDRLLDEQSRNRLAEQAQIVSQRESLKAEIHQVREQAAAIKAKQEKEKSHKTEEKKVQNLQTALLGTIFLIIALAGLWGGQLFLSVAGFIGFLLIVVMKLRLHGKAAEFNEDGGGLSELYKKERALIERLKESEGNNGKAAEEALAKDEILQGQYRDLLSRLEQQNIRYERVIQLFEQWELEWSELNQRQSELAQSFLLNSSTRVKKIYDTFLVIDRQKQLFREKKRIQERLELISKEEKAISSKLEELAGTFLDNPNLPLHDSAVLLKKRLREEIEKEAKYRELQTKLLEIKEECSRLKKEVLQFQEERNNLFRLARVQNEEEFRNQGIRHEQAEKWKERLADIDFQLDVAGVTLHDRRALYMPAELKEELERSKAEVQMVQKEQNNLRDRLAEIKHRIAVLEEGGSYAELLHRYKQMRYEFEEEAKEWAKYALAKEVLNRTVEDYRKERLPKMLAHAEKILQRLTNGEYIRMIPQLSGSGFIIERKDHTLFEANELSQATAEQVYVSVRLALTSTLISRYPFPIIIDDSFVNFDKKRTKRVIELLREYTGNQVLLFTCHDHLLKEFQSGEVFNLNRKTESLAN